MDVHMELTTSPIHKRPPEPGPPLSGRHKCRPIWLLMFNSPVRILSSVLKLKINSKYCGISHNMRPPLSPPLSPPHPSLLPSPHSPSPLQSFPSPPPLLLPHPLS